MNIAIIGEGKTEYYCLPTILGRLNHTVVARAKVDGIGAQYNWEKAIKNRVLPYVQTLALKQPDKILVVVDRETRSDCCGELARRANVILRETLAQQGSNAEVSVVLANRKFECWLFSDPEVLRDINIFRSSQRIIAEIGDQIDERNIEKIINQNLKDRLKWEKHIHGKALAQKIRLDSADVRRRSKSFDKFLREAS